MRNTYRDYFITKHGAETYNMLIQDTKDKYGYVSTDYAEEEVICDSLVALQKKKGFAEDMAKTLYENGYSKNKIKKFFRTVADFFRKMADMVRSLFDDSTVTQAGVYAERDAAFLDKLSDSFFAGMRKVAEYNFEGVDGETRKMKENKYDFTKSFSEQISDYKNGIFPKNDSLIISETPKVWRKVGFNALPVTINQSHVDYAINNTKDSDHFIGETAIKNLPSAISNPIAIIQSKSVIKRPMVIVDVGFGAKKIVLPIEVDGYGKVNNVDIDANAITSVYKKNSALKQLYDAIVDTNNGKIHLFYWNKKEAVRLMQIAGFQLPGVLPQGGFVNSIHHIKSNVNIKLKNNTESIQFKRWFGNSVVKNSDNTPKILYHQTTSVPFDSFDIKMKGAGYYDSELPSGIYMKETHDTIALGDEYEKSHQMSLYASIQTPLIFTNRFQASVFWGKNIIGYKELKNRLDTLNNDYRKKVDVVNNKQTITLQNWKDDNPNAKGSEAYNDINFIALEEEEDRLIEEWEAKTNDISRKMKLLIDSYLEKSKYDGVIINEDEGAGGKIKTYIALNGEQVKSVDNQGTFGKTNNIYKMLPEEQAELDRLKSELERKDAELAESKIEHERYVRTAEKTIKAKERLIQTYSEALAIGAGGNVVSFESVKDIVRGLNERYDLRLSLSDDVSELTKIYSHIANAKNTNSGELLGEIRQFVEKRVIPASFKIDDSLRRQYKGFLRDVLEKKYGVDVFRLMSLESKLVRLESRGLRTAHELYLDTAGEIEARDTAARMNLSAGERKNTRPDIDRSDVVFAGNIGESHSLSPTKIKKLKESLLSLNKKNIILNADGRLIKVTTDDYTIDKNIFSVKGRTNNEVNARIKAIPEFEQILLKSRYFETDTNVRNVDKKAKKGVVGMIKFNTETDGYNVEILFRDKGNTTPLYEVKFIKKSSQQSMPNKIDSTASLEDVENNNSVSQNSDLSTENDIKYLEAVKNGDMATAQAMVEQVAREKGYDKGFYNIIVTQYEPDSLKNYLKDCEIIYDKKTMNGKYQVDSGRIVASAHDMPFIANTIVPKNSDLSTEHKKKIKAFPAVTKINGLKKAGNASNIIIPENSDLSTENDKKCLEAVKNGDMATAQAMVEQAAREKEAEQAIQGLLRCVNSR